MNTLRTYNLIFICILGVIFPYSLFAAEVSFTANTQTVAKEQQFYVDVFLQAENESINGIEGVLIYPKELVTLVRIEDGSSIITPWIERPKDTKGEITFTGIIPGGFQGLIDPFKGTTTGKGKVFRLVFEGKEEGRGPLFFSSLFGTLHDGDGTLTEPKHAPYIISVTNEYLPTVYTVTDTFSPDMEAYVVTEKDLNNGKPTLIVSAIDKESGVSRVELLSGSRDWKIIESPYLLDRKERTSILTVRAYDMEGNYVESVLPKSTKNLFVFDIRIVYFALMCVFLVIITKLYFKKNEK